MWKLPSIVLGAALLTAACSGDTQKVPVSGSEEQGMPQEGETAPVIEAPVMNIENKEIGTATLTEEAGGVVLELDVGGLAPGEHALHFHEKGVCTAPDFKESAGGHFNPEGKEHGFDNPNGSHAGDLENFIADEDGSAKVRYTTDAVTLGLGADNSLIDDNGTALIIHEGADDYKTDPAGDAGSPFACAEITSQHMK